MQSQGYELLTPNAEGQYWIEPLGLNLGTWQGKRQNITAPWLRWWEASGNLLLWGAEKIEKERQKNQRLLQRLQELGVNLEDE